MGNFVCDSTGWFWFGYIIKVTENLQGSFQYSFITEDTYILVSNIIVFWQATVRKSYLWVFSYYLARFTIPILLWLHPIPFVLDIPERILLFALNINSVSIIPGGICLINSLWMTLGHKQKKSWVFFYY